MIVRNGAAGASKPMPVLLTREALCIGSEVIADSSNIESAFIDNAIGTIKGLTIMLDKRSAERMKAATSGNHGQRMGFIVDGELLAAPFIKDTLTDTFNLVLNLSEEELARLAPTLSALRTLQ